MEWLQSVSDHIVELVLSCTEDCLLQGSSAQNLLHGAPGDVMSMHKDKCTCHFSVVYHIYYHDIVL